jgi:hypothetical protein
MKGYQKIVAISPHGARVTIHAPGPSGLVIAYCTERTDSTTVHVNKPYADGTHPIVAVIPRDWVIECIHTDLDK